MDAGPRRGPHLISGATTRPWPSPRPAALPGAGRCSRGGTCLQPGRGPLKLNLDLSAGTRQGAQGRQRKGRCLDFLPPSPRPSRQEKFSRLGQACPLHPGGAGLEALGSVARSWVQGTVGKEIRSGRAGPHNLAPGQPGPPPRYSPRLPGLSPFLLPPPPPPLRPGRRAPRERGLTGRARVSSKRASTSRLLPPPADPSSPFSDPGCAGRAQGAGGGGARRRKRRATGGPSPERSPLQLQPRVPSLPPAPQTRRWRRQLRKETPVLQRHSVLLHRPPQAGDSGGAVAAGSVGARSPGAEQAAGPAPSRRAGMRGRAPWRPITTRRPPARPATASRSPCDGKTSDGFCDLGGSVTGVAALRGGEAVQSGFC